MIQWHLESDGTLTRTLYVPLMDIQVWVASDSLCLLDMFKRSFSARILLNRREGGIPNKFEFNRLQQRKRTTRFDQFV